MRPYFTFILVGLILYLGTKCLYFFNLTTQMPSMALEVILFLFFITALIFRYISRFASQGSDALSRFYLLSIALKLLGGCSFIIAVIVLDREGAPGNVVLFLTGYIAFTAAEIVFLMHFKKDGNASATEAKKN